MWPVVEFRRGPSATSFFSLPPPPSFISVLSILFFPPLCFSVCLLLLRPGLGLGPPGLSVLGGTGGTPAQRQWLCGSLTRDSSD